MTTFSVYKGKIRDTFDKINGLIFKQTSLLIQSETNLGHKQRNNENIKSEL